MAFCNISAKLFTNLASHIFKINQMKKILVFALSLSVSMLSFAQQNDVVGKNIDKTAKPGEDFFKYANGGWTKQNPIPAAYSQWGIGNLVQEDVWTKLRTISENAVLQNKTLDKVEKQHP